MDAAKKYLRQQLCPPPATVIQKWSEYMAAEAKLLARHRASDAKLLADLVTSHSKLLQKHADARETLLSSFTAPVSLPVVVAVAFVLASFLLCSYFLAHISTKIHSRLHPYNTRRLTPRPTPSTASIFSRISHRIPDYRQAFRRLRVPPPPSSPTFALQFPQALKTAMSSLTTSSHRWYTSLLGPRPHDLTTAALSASTLLSTFAASAAGSNGVAQKQRLNAALVGLLAIRAKVRARDGDAGMRVLSDELTIDAGCVICCAEVVDTVLMPCRHMVVCGSCSTRLGVRSERAWGSTAAKCPVCRRPVDHSIKVFRG